MRALTACGTLRSMPSDTTDLALRAQIAAAVRLGPEGRLRVAVELSEETRRIAVEGVMRRHPDYDEARARLSVARLLVGPELAERAFGQRGR
jgi:hypothetical protein